MTATGTDPEPLAQHRERRRRPALIYPGMMLLARPDGAFAIIDLHEVKLSAVGQKFIEDGPIPADSTDAGFAWFKEQSGRVAGPALPRQPSDTRPFLRRDRFQVEERSQ
ncbi:MAG: hypothetical protein KIS68_02860 [Bauldia sp.]|nr:hypothetical protein [Bauldia sp.]